MQLPCKHRSVAVYSARSARCPGPNLRCSPMFTTVFHHDADMNFLRGTFTTDLSSAHRDLFESVVNVGGGCVPAKCILLKSLLSKILANIRPCCIWYTHISLIPIGSISDLSAHHRRIFGVLSPIQFCVRGTQFWAVVGRHSRKVRAQIRNRPISNSGFQ